MFKKKFTNKNYIIELIIELTFSNNSILEFGQYHILERLIHLLIVVQYCNIKEKIANIITGFAIENDISIIYLLILLK